MPTLRKTKCYGWIPDLPDHRDFPYLAVPKLRLPKQVDLRSLDSKPVYQQGDLGSCTSQAIAAQLEFLHIKESLPVYTPSRLFVYYGERVIEGTVSEDSGAYLRDGIKVVAAQGCCRAKTWPYHIRDFTLKPSQPAYSEAALHKAITYSRILTGKLAQMKNCLASGFPFVFGFTVYESFESDEVTKTGKVAMPAVLEPVIGGHAVMALGYDDSHKWVIARNSWGPDWGDAGYFYLPYAYIGNQNLADDFWTIRFAN